MMNDNMTIEETITPDIAAEIEHREWERGNEQRERWEAIEAIHGPLLTKAELDAYHKDMAEIMAERDAAFENAFKCDEDDDEDAWSNDDDE
tara:strand:- start:197 stop:469 length:273 start_codon:yes stop_codon:yes gene_type:complete